MTSKLRAFFEGKKVLILGFGLEGKSTYKLLKMLDCAALVAVADAKPLPEELDCLKFTGDEYEQRVKELESETEYDIIMKSPGIALYDRVNESQKSKITSQSDLFLRFYEGNVVGVTGTKGKSTVSALINHILNNCGKKAILIGNIGIPPLENLSHYDDNTIVVIELSAQQLEYVKASPRIAVLLNIYPEHLDHFTDFEAYKAAKENIFKQQKPGDVLIYDETLKAPPNIKTKLIGAHNLYNIAVALKAATLCGAGVNTAIKAAETFSPLAHRLEPLGLENGIEYVNDSISTIPQSTVNALKALPDTDVLIVGGVDRGVCYDDLFEHLEKDENLKFLIALPGAGRRIAACFDNVHTAHRFEIYLASDLKDAVEFAKTVAKKRCLLSPAAASYDAYKNFEERGEHFKKLVKLHK
ncbi:MAG: Mur ligase family protein [Oscillospiraceae bacterium]|nr:Mur ligase family protein [Oscillospiraceae bacterium]